MKEYIIKTHEFGTLLKGRILLFRWFSGLDNIGQSYANSYVLVTVQN